MPIDDLAGPVPPSGPAAAAARPGRDTPDQGPARDAPDQGPVRGTPDRGPARDAPDQGPVRGTPDRGPVRGTPDRGPVLARARVRPVAPAPRTSSESRWQTPRFWLVAQWFASAVVAPLLCRLVVTGDVPDVLRDGPLILAGNHVSNLDPICAAAAAARRGVAPRMMATGGLFRTPVIGRLMVAAGHIPVDRGRETVAAAVPAAVAALRAGSVVFVYPEGRIGLDPTMWPERPKSGLARLALATGATVVPVATWGAHEVIAYHGRGAMVGRLIRSLWRRPTVRVHFGAPVDLSGLRDGAVGQARVAGERVMRALVADLARLRPDEPGLPAYRDPTRPLSVARRWPAGPAGGGASGSATHRNVTAA